MADEEAFKREAKLVEGLNLGDIVLHLRNELRRDQAFFEAVVLYKDLLKGCVRLFVEYIIRGVSHIALSHASQRRVVDCY